MTSGPAFQQQQQSYAQAVGTASTGRNITRDRDPTSNDVVYTIGQFWQNTTLGNLWYLNSFTSTNATLQANWINIGTGSTPFDSIIVQTGTSPVVADGSGQVTFNGAVVAAGTNPVRTDGTGPNTMALEVQISQAIAATDATKIGLSNFNSTQFSVDANGFVSLAGAGQAIDSIAMQTGTSPIVPTGAGLVTLNGAVVAAGTNPIRTNGTGANTGAVQVQISQAIASTNATNIGLAAFDSAHFTVDANGFVSATGGQIIAVTGITNADSPYTVVNTDYFIGCNTTGGAITVLLPNAPTKGTTFVIKDTFGTSNTNNITVTTVGGVVTIDGATSFVIANKRAAMNVVYDGGAYEVF